MSGCVHEYLTAGRTRQSRVITRQKAHKTRNDLRVVSNNKIQKGHAAPSWGTKTTKQRQHARAHRAKPCTSDDFHRHMRSPAALILFHNRQHSSTIKTGQQGCPSCRDTAVRENTCADPVDRATTVNVCVCHHSSTAPGYVAHKRQATVQSGHAVDQHQRGTRTC